MTNETDAMYCTWSYRESLPPNLRAQFRDLDHLVRVLCSSATSQLLLAAPYLSSAGLESLQSGIAAAAQRGASVRLLTGDLGSDESANRKALRALVNGQEGAIIRRHLRVLTPTNQMPDLVHAKIVLSDHSRGYLGSANFSQSALERNFELGVCLTTSQVAAIEALLAFYEAKGLIADCTQAVLPAL